MSNLAQSGFTPAADAVFCAEILPAVSRTFALSIEMLPETLRDAVRIAYLLCRVVDTIEDEDAANIEMDVRLDLFDAFDRKMTRDDEDPSNLSAMCVAADLGEGADAKLCANAAAVFRGFRRLSVEQRNAIRPHVLEMSRGMREYALRAHAEGELVLRDLADLERYCYFVAGTVGELLTALFEQDVSSIASDQLRFAHDRAVSFGLGLQLVNIVKDVATDAERDVCFMPLAMAAGYDLKLEEILRPEKRPQALSLLRAVCARAREHLTAAQEYTLAWPEEEGAGVRLFCAVPLVLALATLREVEHGQDTLRPGFVPKVSREVVFEALNACQDAIREDKKMLAVFARYQ